MASAATTTQFFDGLRSKIGDSTPEFQIGVRQMAIGGDQNIQGEAGVGPCRTDGGTLTCPAFFALSPVTGGMTSFFGDTIALDPATVVRASTRVDQHRPA